MERIAHEPLAGMGIGGDMKLPLRKTQGHGFAAAVQDKERHHLLAELVIHLAGDDRASFAEHAAAMNDGVRKVEKYKEERMAAVTGGLPLPPGMKLF